MRVFISFASRDREIVRHLEAQLRARKPEIDFFLDERGLTGGVYWISRLGEELQKADVVLLLLGQTIGRWQELEYYQALQLSRLADRGGRPRIIPVVITDNPSPGLPFLATLHQIFALDLTSATAFKAIDGALQAVPTGKVEDPWRRFQPYKGLPAFGTTDAAFFFGREKELGEILELLSRTRGRVVTLIGQSGVGKSSLAFAGILSRLKSQLPPVDGMAWPAGLKDSRSFLQLTMRPGPDPLKELAACLVRLYGETDAAIDKEAGDWAERFRAGSLMRDMLRLAREKIAQKLGGYPPKGFILYVDQSEELYTRAPIEDARVFSRLLANATEENTLSVLMSLRSDFYQNFQNDTAIFALSEKVDVLPLTQDVLADVIRKPAETLGARFEDNNMPTVIAAATDLESGALPLLSDLLQEVWLSMLGRGDGVLRWSDQPGIMDIGLPLKRRADAFLELPTTDINAVRRLFTIQLAQVSTLGEPVRRRARKDECRAEEWLMAEQLASADQRLLVISNSPLSGGPIVEVAHEQLLRRWPTLKGWLDQQREFLIWRTEMELAAKAYRDTAPAQKSEALLMGLRLTTAETWFLRRKEDLPTSLRDFVKESIDQRDNLLETQRKAETARQAIETRFQKAELERARLERATAEGEKELERLRADSAEQNEASKVRELAQAKQLLDANIRVSRRTNIGLGVAVMLLIAASGLGLLAWNQLGAATQALNDTAIALSSAELSQGKVLDAADRALHAFAENPKPASRSALLAAALNISPYLQRKIVFSPTIEALEWMDAQTLVVADGGDRLRFLNMAAGQPMNVRDGKDPFQKFAGADREYITVAGLKTLASGLIVAVLNNGAINILDRNGSMIGAFPTKPNDEAIADVLIMDAAQDAALVLFTDSQRLKSFKCGIDQGKKQISCKEAPVPAINNVAGFAAGRLGKSLFVAHPQEGADSTTFLVEAYDESGNARPNPLSFTGSVRDLSLSSDGAILALTNDGRVRLIDVQSWKTRPALNNVDEGSGDLKPLTSNVWRPGHLDLPLSCYVFSICLSSGDPLQRNDLVFRNAERFDGHHGAITHLAWDPTGRQLATREIDALLIWSLEQSPDVARNLISGVEQRPGLAVAMAPDRKSIAVAVSGENRIAKLDIGGSDGKSPTFIEASSPIKALAIASDRLYAVMPDQVAVATLGAESKFELIEGTNLADSDAILAWSGHGDEIIFADGEQIGSIDSAVKDPKPRFFARPTPTTGLYGLTVDYKRGQVLASYRGGSLVAFDLTSRTLIDRLKNSHSATDDQAKGSRSLAVNTTGSLLAASGTGSVIVYDLERRESTMKLAVQPANVEVVGVAFNPSGQKLAALGAVGELTIWDIGRGPGELSLSVNIIENLLPRDLSLDRQRPTSLAWSDDSHVIVSGGILTPQIISISELDWARRVSQLLGSGLDKH